MSREEGSVSDLRTWRYRTWSGGNCTVVGSSIEFQPAHVVFRDKNGLVILAEKNENVKELSEIGTGGSATRGVRPLE